MAQRASKNVPSVAGESGVHLQYSLTSPAQLDIKCCNHPYSLRLLRERALISFEAPVARGL